MLAAVVLDVLKKEPGDARASHPMFEASLSWLKRSGDLFSQLPEAVIAEMMKCCQFFSVPANTLIIKQGDHADSFYAVLKGNASAWVLSGVGENLAKLNSITQGQQLTIIDKHKLGSCVKRYAPGGTFGELALIMPDGVRNASVLSDEHCEMMTVDRDLYNKLLLNFQKQEYEDRLELCNNTPLFSQLQKIHRQKLAMAMEKIHLDFDNFLTVQLQPASYIYFIVKGKAKLIVDPALHQHQQNVLPSIESALTTTVKSQIENRQGRRSSSQRMQASLANHLTSVTPPTFKDNNAIDRVQRMHSIARSKTAIELAANRREYIRPGVQEVCWVNPGEVIGVTEAILGIDTYLWSCIATEALEVYGLSLHNFRRILSFYRTNEAVAIALEQECYKRVKDRFLRIGSPLCLDLLRHLKTNLEEAEAAAIEAARPLDPPSRVIPNWSDKLESFRRKQLKSARARTNGWQPPKPCTDAKTINDLYRNWQDEQKQAALMSDDSVVKALTKEEKKARLLHKAMTKVNQQNAHAISQLRLFALQFKEEEDEETDPRGKSEDNATRSSSYF